ncbi:MAG: hypothetical protein ACXAC7_22295, partial [Candidatus Hodarchaeales archaeon]
SSYQFITLLLDSEIQHNLHVYAQDIAGNWQYSQFTFTTDNTPPGIFLNSPVNNSVQQSGTTIDFTITGANGSLIYHWDNNKNLTVSESFDPVLPMSDGLHQLNVYIRDEAGNWVFIYFGFITDDTSPNIILNNPMNKTLWQSGIPINFTIIGANGTLIFHWDDDLNSTEPDIFDPTIPTGDGLHQLYLYVKDLAGNWNTTYLEYQADNTPPDILNNLANGTTWQSGTEIQIIISDTNTLKSVTYHWDEISNTTVTLDNSTYSISFFTPIGDGNHTLFIKAFDNVSNEKSIFLTYITDDTPPVIVLMFPQNTSDQEGRTEILLDIQGSTSVYTYHWDTESNNTISINTHPVLPQSSGIHRLYVYASDEVGNNAIYYYEFTVPQPIQSTSSSENTTTSPGYNTIIMLFTLLGIIALRRRKIKNSVKMAKI